MTTATFGLDTFDIHHLGEGASIVLCALVFSRQQIDPRSHQGINQM